jgi:hypothetical protein
MIISGQLYWICRSFKADHERRKKQATIEFGRDVFEHIEACQKFLFREFNDKIINIDDLQKDEHWLYARDMMANLEILSTGINAGIYDIDIIDRMFGSFIIRMNKKMGPYIEHQRDGGSRASVFTEFTNLALEITKRRNQTSGAGSIEHS